MLEETQVANPNQACLIFLLVYLITQHDSQPKEKVQRILNAGLEAEAQADVQLQELLSWGPWDAQPLHNPWLLASEKLLTQQGSVHEGTHEEQGVLNSLEHHLSVTRLFLVAELISNGLTQVSLHRTAA